MKKILQRTFLLSLLFLTHFIISDDCSTTFINRLKSECTNFFSNDTHTCEYSGGKCGFKYISCSSYEGQDESTCSSIKPLYLYKKCEIQGTKCTEVDKKCEDFEEGLTCSYLSHENNQRCVFNEGKCTTYYNSCTDAPKDKCTNNIPSNSAKKCEWDSTNSVCNEVDKKCNDYPDSIPSDEYCGNYQTSDSTKKVCFPKQTGGCEERYKTCELYNTNENRKNKENCESIIPYVVYKNGAEDYDYDLKCVFSEGTCSTKDKECKDYNNMESSCKYFTLKDADKVCAYKGTQCIEQYKTCELYNSKASSKNRNDCLAIQPYIDGRFDNSKICDYTGDVCSTRDKSCQDITEGETACLSFIPNDSNKRCIYSGSQCKEQYKTCYLYNQNASPKDATECKNIKLYNNYGELDTVNVCDYINSECKQRPKKCSEYKTEEECEYKTYDDFVCIFKGNTCTEQYKTLNYIIQKLQVKIEMIV